MNPRNVVLIFCLLVSNMFAQHKLDGFITSPYFDEQICNFMYDTDLKVMINAPSEINFDPTKPINITFYGLANTSIIEQTEGKLLSPGDDWRFDIQHVAAQTRFIRNEVKKYNLVVVYIETAEKSFPLWKSKNLDKHSKILRELIWYVKNLFNRYENYIVLNGHSGGGRFVFSYLDGFEEIPNFVKRICFLDSDYGYEEVYGKKFVDWLNKYSDNKLSVIAYNDSVALYKGKRVVSDTGGTWYRSRKMQEYLSKYFEFTSTEDSLFIKHNSLNKQIQIILKHNPNKEVLHTKLVDKNGFIHSMLYGTEYEEENYTFYDKRAYTEFIQTEKVYPTPLLIKPRSKSAKSGTEFIKSIAHLPLIEREELIFNELKDGNIPNYYRRLVNINSEFEDSNSVKHILSYWVMPDYLAVGDDDDFCRVPITPMTAQKIANLYGAILPTRKLVNDIYKNCSIKLEPVTYFPIENQNELVSKFSEHNLAIEKQKQELNIDSKKLTGGIKKDIVLSNLIADSNRVNHVVIYGWHRLTGIPIQPQTNIHINTYVDYSHGVRLLNNKALLDGKLVFLSDLLKDPILFKLLSDEPNPISNPQY